MSSVTAIPPDLILTYPLVVSKFSSLNLASPKSACTLVAEPAQPVVALSSSNVSADVNDNLLCAIAALALTSAFIIAPAAICKSISVSDAVLVAVILISLPEASTPFENSSIGSVNTVAVAVKLVNEFPKLKVPATAVYETILTLYELPTVPSI